MKQESLAKRAISVWGLLLVMSMLSLVAGPAVSHGPDDRPAPIPVPAPHPASYPGAVIATPEPAYAAVRAAPAPVPAPRPPARVAETTRVPDALSEAAASTTERDGPVPFTAMAALLAAMALGVASWRTVVGHAYRHQVEPGR